MVWEQWQGPCEILNSISFSHFTPRAIQGSQVKQNKDIIRKHTGTNFTLLRNQQTLIKNKLYIIASGDLFAEYTLPLYKHQ